GRAAPRPSVRDRGRMEAEARRRHARHGGDPHARAARSAPLGHPPMKRMVLAVLVLGCAATVALAQGGAPRTPLPARVTAKLGMLNVPALSPLWLLPEYAAAYNIQIETVMFQRFADGRTALASGDLDITAFGPRTSPSPWPRAPDRSSGWRAWGRATTACSCAEARTSATGRNSGPGRSGSARGRSRG